MRIQINKQAYKILIEKTIFSVDIDENLKTCSFPYLLAVWYQTLYLYTMLPRYAEKSPVIQHYWKQYKENLEMRLREIASEIYSRAKPIFLKWTDYHDVKNYKKMFKVRAEDLIETWQTQLGDAKEGVYIADRKIVWQFALEKDEWNPIERNIPGITAFVKQLFNQFFRNCLKDAVLEKFDEFIEHARDNWNKETEKSLRLFEKIITKLQNNVELSFDELSQLWVLLGTPDFLSSYIKINSKEDLFILAQIVLLWALNDYFRQKNAIVETPQWQKK